MSFSKHSLNLKKKLTSLQKFCSISLKAAEWGVSRSGVNVPCNVAVPGKRRVAMADVASLLSGVNG